MDSPLAHLVAAAERGDRAAGETLFSALYEELHRLARRELARLGGQVGLGVTTLLHEAYLDIAARDGMAFDGRGQFMRYAARVMRGLVIDHVRNRCAQKRGGQFEITWLATDAPDSHAGYRELQAISDALDELARHDPAGAELVDLKFFCGFSFGEIATMRQVSARTVQRQWEKARIYLHQTLSASPLDGVTHAT